MTEAKLPKYQRGRRVKVMFDLINDVSFPNAPAKVILVSLGEIVQVGRHTRANLPSSAASKEKSD
ncbi:nitrogen fixation protein NifZ [Bradyrhizobium sp. Pa8]|uniref:nitrogen fixation protein NifZ n=1 Tax=Bradyrhizobium sp. Pa8 TaxID=3386552 RepID=UPI00403F4B78